MEEQKFHAIVWKIGCSYVITIPHKVILWKHIEDKQEVEVTLRFNETQI